MNSNKLEISGQGAVDPPQAAYKPIQDAEEIPLTRPKSLVTTPKSTLPESDGSDEKMLPNEEKMVSPNSNISAGDVKFTSNDKQNGDAKLDIGEIKTAFVGMDKEELMKYAKDPFWIRLRWFLFIGFWLLWAGMLVGAIYIIIVAPKCSPPTPKTWWEQGPLANTRPDKTGEELEKLHEAHFKGLIVMPDFDVYTPYNTLSPEFIDFMKGLQTSPIKGIIDLNPVASTMWFEQSVNRDEEYDDYYIWKKPKTNNVEQAPPTNWLTPENKSAWTYSTVRKEYYLTFNGKPQLNFRNPKVVDKFSEVIKTYLKEGAAGIRVVDASALLVDAEFRDENVGTNINSTVGEYNFYSHSRTRHQEELGPLLNEWRTIVKATTDNGPFMISDELPSLKPYRYNGTLVIDLPKHSHVFNSGKALNATLLKHNLDSAFIILENHWPLWERNQENLAKDILDVVTLLLPGTTLIDFDHTIYVNKALIELRTSPSIMYGNCSTYEVGNKKIFALIRVTSGNPGFLVAVNPTNEKVSVDFKAEIPSINEDVTVHYISEKFTEKGIELKMKADAKNITLSPESAIILTYVPKAPE